jgi:integrase
MGRTLGKLKPLTISRTLEPGLYTDGGGLYLQVSGKGAKSWIYRYMLAGRSREMGLGGLDAIPLADARLLAAEARHQRAKGIDPIEHRRAERTKAELEKARAMTFDQCANAYIAAHKPSWKNEKHQQQWENTLKQYATPVFGTLPVQDVDTTLVMKVLEPLWLAKTETASRLRGRIESVLDWAKTRGYRAGENPARWRGYLENLLPKRSKVQRVRHHPALPYQEIGAFVAELRQQAGVAARALEFLILTVSRTSEVTGAGSAEFDTAAKVWSVPGARMKAGRDHRVPLSARAVEIAEDVKKLGGAYLFPGGRKGKPLSENAMLALLERMGRTDITTHGFRSTFRDWASEHTNFPNHVVEMALAHTIADKVEAAYRRGDLFEKRRQLMEAWARYCSTLRKAGDVVPIRAAG